MPAPVIDQADVGAWRQVAQLSAGDRITIHAGFGEVPVIITEVHAGDSRLITEGFALGRERHTRVQVTITQSAIRNRLYRLRAGWDD